MFPFQLSGPPFTDQMSARIQVPAIRPPAIGVKAANPSRSEQRLQCQKRTILPPTEDIGYDPARLMIQSPP
jgi:hypothetical protein